MYNALWIPSHGTVKRLLSVFCLFFFFLIWLLFDQLKDRGKVKKNTQGMSGLKFLDKMFSVVPIFYKL